MNKGVTKEIFQMQGVPTPVGLHVLHSQKDLPLSDLGFSLPVVVKPCSGGSSLGVHIVHTDEEYREAMRQSFLKEDEVVIEPFINGREYACGIFDGKALPLVEIVPSDGFFDYTEKYTLKSSKIHMPARVDEQMEKKIQETAKQIYRALACKGFARVDLFLTPEQKLVFNEVNTIPGFTSHSRYPNMMKGIGMTFSEILERLIELEVR